MRTNLSNGPGASALVVAVLFSVSAAAQATPTQSYELWIKLGQSNAVGTLQLKAPNLQSPLDVNGVDAPDPRVLEVARPHLTQPWPVPPGAVLHLQRERSWDWSSHPLDDISFHQSFGKARVAANPAITVAIWNGARGSTAMDQWLPGRTLFETAVNEVNTFLAQSPGYQFKGILWHQGESDAIQGRTQKQYEADLAYMVRELRRRVPGGQHAVFVAGTMSSAWRLVGSGAATPQRIDAIHQAHLRIPQYIPRSAIVGLDDLVVTDNVIHFDRHHLREIGSRFAAAAATLLATPASLPPSYQFLYDPIAMAFVNYLGPAGSIPGQTLTARPRPRLTTVPVGGPVAGFTGAIQLASEQYTKALWVRLSQPANEFTSFLSIGFVGNNTANLMVASRVGHGTYVGSAANPTFLDPTNYPSGLSPLVPGSWVHLCVTYSGTEFRAYANGRELIKSPYTTATQPMPATSQLDIGRWTPWPPSQMYGEIDNIVVLPYAAHPEEVPGLMR